MSREDDARQAHGSIVYSVQYKMVQCVSPRYAGVPKASLGLCYMDRLDARRRLSRRLAETGMNQT